ncbi:CagC family type IV secretion system protein [Lactiplantibacillus plantarum]|uniref:CagC family type IV secretion system protein n=1 Tax=Lactiplantibacillus plantarum TaxID=1590 RepID=UPI0034D2E24B
MVTKSASNLISNLAKHDFNLLCLRVITHEHLTIAIVFFHIYWVVTLIMQSRIIKRMPDADDPREKSEVYHAVGRVAGLVALAAAIIWLLPWVYSLFT